MKSLLRLHGVAEGSPILKLGVVIDETEPARWISELIGYLSDLPGVEISVLSSGMRAPGADQVPPLLTERLQAASRRSFDPFSAVRLPAEMVPLSSVRCGLLLWLGASRPKDVSPSAMAEHGVCSVALGQRPQMIPLWDELARDADTSVSTIYWHTASFAAGRPIARAETTNEHGLYFTVSAREPVAGMIRLFGTLAVDLQRDPAGWKERFTNVPEEAIEPFSDKYPSNFAAARFIAGKLSRSAYLRWRTRGKRARWSIGLKRNDGGTIADSREPKLAGFQTVPCPPGCREMADPFLQERGGRTWLFYEDVPKGSIRGRLSCVELLDDGSCSEAQTILSCDYHLSYPCVMEAGGELFLMPESSEAKRVDLFRFKRFPAEVELVTTPMEGIGLTDTTPIFLDGRWYFFTTTVQPFMESVLFWSDKLEGPWRLHPASPVSCSVRHSRGAGNLFWRGNDLFRPTQDCSVRYGYAMRVNRVTRLTPTEFAEERVAWVGPNWMPGLLGAHTWNRSSRYQVVDGLVLGPDTEVL